MDGARVRVLRKAAARWRRRTEKLTPMLICLMWCCFSGCAKVPPPPPREFTVSVEVQRTSDGSSIV